MDPQKTAEQIGNAANEIGKKLNVDPHQIAKKLNVDPKKAEPVLKTWRDWFLMVAAALYVLSPLDLIPEGIFGVFGLIDDLLVILIAAIWYINKYQATQNFTKKYKWW